MDFFIQFFTTHAPHAHWIIFSLLLLAGMNIPISEDLLVITCAILASTVIPENLVKLFTFLVVGCYLADMICYWIGRLFGKHLWKLKWFNRTVPPKRLLQAQEFYRKHGFYTLIIGRFIPFGVRNALFLTAGLGKMSFPRFLASDAIACLLSNTTLFTITYTLGKNYIQIFSYLKTFKIAIFSVFVVTAIFLILFYKKRKGLSNIKKTTLELEDI